MADDWIKEEEKRQKAEDEARERERTERQRTMDTAKALIKDGNVKAALALFGIEPRETKEANSDDALILNQLRMQIELEKFWIEHRNSLEALPRAYSEAAIAVEKRLAEISVTDYADAFGELSGLKADYGWLFDGAFKGIAGELERLVELVSKRAVQAEVNLRQHELDRSSGRRVPLRIVKLPAEFYQKQMANITRQESDRRKAAELRDSINDARTKVGLGTL
jgi:hypothetical protein